MPYEPFIEEFHDLAFKEMRSITIQDSPWLPADDYGFLELYCNDEDCDCRRVMFSVISRKQTEILAVIAYGWENAEFYAHWYHGNNPNIIREMQGPALNIGSPQSELAPALLELVRDTLLADPAYIERLKRHYRMFKEKVDPAHFKPSGKPASSGGPEPSGPTSSGSPKPSGRSAPRAKKKGRPRSSR